jgi:integrase
MVNPTLGLALPAVRARRERVARPEEAAALIAAAPAGDRGLWATALYAGLRRGELMALRWEDVDFDAGLIRVERGWDKAEGPIEPKSLAGRRRMPMAQPLRAHLAAHRPASGSAGDLVFGRNDGQPFGQAVVNRARRGRREDRKELPTDAYVRGELERLVQAVLLVIDQDSFAQEGGE